MSPYCHQRLDSPVSDVREPLDLHFTDAVVDLAAGPERSGDQPVAQGSRLTIDQTAALFEAQCQSRHVDFAAKWMQSQGRGFYTIGSSGHEGNAAIAAALTPGDPAL